MNIVAKAKMHRSFLFSLILLFSLCFATHGQKEANIWCFGNGAGLDFTSGSPTTITSQIATNEGCATISDKQTGRLLFYTDGITVWDSTHAVMPSGVGLLGNSSSTQSGVIVPMPGSDSLYYIFTTAAQTNADGMNYSIVDMSLNGGLGDVSTKNVQLLTPCDEKITAVKHCNGNDIWVIAHQWDSDSLFAYLLTNTGLLAPVKSKAGIVHTGGNANTIGYLKASPNGKKLAGVIYGDLYALEIYDFDNSTGIVSNAIVETYTIFSGFFDGLYGASFSPDNSKLYVSIYGTSSATNRIYQYDMSSNVSSTILSSKTMIASWDLGPFGAMQIGPDEKIYIARGGLNFIDVIHKPNLLGTSCNYQPNILTLEDGTTSSLGLPDFIESFFGNNIFTSTDTIVCGPITLNAGNPGSTYLWSDGSTSDKITTSASGKLWVQIDDGCNIKTDTIDIINNAPQVDLADTIKFCSDKYVLDAGNQGASFLWSSGETSQSIEVSSSGKYWVRVTNTLCSASDTTYLKYEKSIPNVTSPNIFTPNNDGINDLFDLAIEYVVTYKIKIYNRWGQIVYEGSDPNSSWDGKYKGTDVSNGVYFWEVDYLSQCAVDENSTSKLIGNVSVFK